MKQICVNLHVHTQHQHIFVIRFFFQLNSNHDADGSSSSKSTNQNVQTGNTKNTTKLVELKQPKLILEDISKKTQPLRVGEDDEPSDATKVLNVKRLIFILK